MNVGVLAGEKIFGEKVKIEKRVGVVERMNAGELDGLIVSNEVAGYGFNMTGANHIIFLGSLYSLAYEEQISGAYFCFIANLQDGFVEMVRQRLLTFTLSPT